MRASELYYALSNLDYVDRSNWDLTRLICLISAQKASKKKLKLKDICTFAWDTDDSVTEDEIKSMFDQSKRMEDILNNKDKK